jgi:hypothetical protein
VNAVSRDRTAWMPLVEPRRVRSLGEDLALPRPLYFTQIPFILAFTGTISWIIASEYALVVSSIVGGAIGCYMLFDWLFRGETRFSTIIAFSLLIAYGLGTFNTWASTSRGGLTLGEFMGQDDAVLARGLAAALLSCSITIFFGELFERPLFGRDFHLRPDPRIYSFIYLGALAAIGSFAAGALSLGSDTSDPTHQGFVHALLLWIFSPLLSLSVTVFLLTPRGGLRRKIVGVAALILLIILTVMGRRVMFYTVLETVFLARVCGVRLKGPPHKKVLVFALVVTFIVGGALVFMLYRVSGYGGGARKNLVGRMQIMAEWVREGTALQTALSSTQSNVKTRTFVLGFFANILDGSATHTPALGEDTIGLFQIAIPSALDPSKDKFFSEELLVDRLFGFGYKDAANSLLTNGATDFGLIGVLFFPLAVSSILKVLTEFASWRLNQFAVLTVILGNLFVCLSAETTIAGYASVLIHGLFFSVGVVIFFALPRFQIQR